MMIFSKKSHHRRHVLRSRESGARVNGEAGFVRQSGLRREEGTHGKQGEQEQEEGQGEGKFR